MLFWPHSSCLQNEKKRKMPVKQKEIQIEKAQCVLL